MNILNGWRVTVALTLWRAIVAFKKYGEPLQRLLKHYKFCGLIVHNKNRELNNQPVGVALRNLKRIK